MDCRDVVVSLKDPGDLVNSVAIGIENVDIG